MQDVTHTSQNHDDDEQQDADNGIAHTQPKDEETIPSPSDNVLELPDGTEHVDQTTGEQDQGYPLPGGFEDSDTQETFDLESALSAIANRSRPIPRKQPPTQKSPRRFDEVDEEDSPRLKRPRKSLFGGFEDDEDEDEANQNFQTPKTHEGSYGLEGNMQWLDNPDPVASSAHGNDLDILFDENSNQYNNLAAVNGSRPSDNIGYRMSSLNLIQDDAEEDQERYDPLALSNDRSSHRESSSPPARKSETIPYTLRNNLDRLITGACMDVDRSGDYDPEEEARKAKLERAKARERKKQAKKARRQPDKIPKCIVRLKFRAFGTVMNITDGIQNWPDDWSDVGSEEEEEVFPTVRYRRRSPGWTAQRPIKDPKGILDDITGYPFARGCKSCRRNGQRCAMIDGDTWPCDQCDNQGLDCEPIILPVEKGKCNNCADTLDADEENYCSFEMSGLEPHDVCRQCAQAGHDDCIPGNLEGYAVPRIDLDKYAWSEERKHTSCTNCRINKKKCTVKEKTDHGPCKQCRKADLHCTFLDTPPKIDRRKKAHRKKGGETSKAGSSRGQPNNNMSRSLQPQYMDPADLEDLDKEEYIPNTRSPSPEIKVKDTDGREGVVKEIATCWAHPIVFNAEDAAGCNFCGVPAFGITGFCEIRVHALEWSNGLGYTEIYGGHRGEYDQTVVCSNCTLTRLQTIMCPGHTISRRAHKVDEIVAVEKLVAAEPQSDDFLRQLKEWCSFCFRIATHKCRTVQPSLAAHADDEQNMVAGCGLRLCDTCEVRLRTEFQNSSTAMAASLDEEPKPKKGGRGGVLPGQPRADVEFLREDGLLMKNIQALA
jgi:hypothetical protein